MIIILGTAKLGEGTLEAGRAAMEAMVAASLAEEGVIDYTFAVDVGDPTLLRIAEKYVDKEALSLHAKSAHMAEFQKATAGIEFKVLDLTMFNADHGTKLI